MNYSFVYSWNQVESNLSAKRIVVHVCFMIVKRGGRLGSAGIVGILQRMEEESRGIIFEKRVVVATMDRMLYENYPQYRRNLQDAIIELLGTKISKNVAVERSKDRGCSLGCFKLHVCARILIRAR
ncbi:Hexokinase-2 [Morus notabilis]|uniref:Phosphotransferase n=1 Tax=Morus notabilis TaxID=981085 RepID=W9SEU0_9ROSA|nr:Hexokinase-2 [Morus notabilis]